MRASVRSNTAAVHHPGTLFCEALPLHLQGSCHCGAVSFSVECHSPVEAGLDFVAPWVDVPEGPGHVHCARWPNESLEEWHKRLGVWSA